MVASIVTDREERTVPNVKQRGAGERQAAPPKLWQKPRMRVLVAGYFDNTASDGVFRNFHEACWVGDTYPPSTTCQYQNPPS